MLGLSTRLVSCLLIPGSPMNTFIQSRSNKKMVGKEKERSMMPTHLRPEKAFVSKTPKKSSHIPHTVFLFYLFFSYHLLSFVNHLSCFLSRNRKIGNFVLQTEYFKNCVICQNSSHP